MPTQTTTSIEPETKPPGRKPRAPRRHRPDLTHWPKAWEMTVRAARNDEGEAVHELVDAMTTRYGWKLPAMSWSRIAPFWYVAEVQGVLLGAVQVCIGWPVGRLELLSVRPGLSQTKRAKVVKALLYYTTQAIKLDGTALVCALINDKDASLIRILERYGAKFAARGQILLYELQRR